jgi:mono/diheme cytochrome c family protein
MRRALLAGLAASLVACETRGVLQPPDPTLQRMVEQARLRPYAATSLFADGRAMREPPAGTVPWRGDGRADDAETQPRGWTLATLTRGRDRYARFCAPCHGLAGDSLTPVADRMQAVRPPSLQAPRQRALTDAEIERAVAAGYGAMASYADVLPAADRWAVVGYVRALQRSQAVRLADLPEPLRREAARELLP